MPESFLVIDDSKLLHQMYRLIFSQGDLAGSTVHYAANGREGYAMLAAHPELTLVLLDLRMPDMDGVAFLRELRSSPRLRMLPVVLTTVEPDGSPMLVEATGLGVTAVVKKPWKPQHLRQVVQTALSAPGR